MVEEFTENLIEKVREYVFLCDTGHPEYKNPLLIDLVHPPPSPFFFYNSVLTEVLPHRNWTS
jgi:hypothetical protein